jgi:hypothetical protein
VRKYSWVHSPETFLTVWRIMFSKFPSYEQRTNRTRQGERVLDWTVRYGLIPSVTVSSWAIACSQCLPCLGPPDFPLQFKRAKEVWLAAAPGVWNTLSTQGLNRLGLEGNWGSLLSPRLWPALCRAIFRQAQTLHCSYNYVHLLSGLIRSLKATDRFLFKGATKYLFQFNLL